MKKKIFLILFFALILPLMFCTKVEAAKITISYPPTLYCGESKNINITVKNVLFKTRLYTKTFTSNNNNILQVDSNGEVTGKNAGTSTIKTLVKYLNKTYGVELKITVKNPNTPTQSTPTQPEPSTPKKNKLSDLGTVTIKETDNDISTKGNPYLKDNRTWCLNFNGYNALSKKSEGTSYPNGAVALYTIQGIRGMSPNEKFLKERTDSNSTYFVKGVGTNFKIIGYKWAPSYSTYKDFLQAIYDEITDGYPVAIHVYTETDKDIYVVGYAVNSNKVRTAGKLSANDIYVIDTEKGKWAKLGDFKEFKTDGKYVLGIYDTTSNNITSNTYTFTDSKGQTNTYKIAVTSEKLNSTMKTIIDKGIRQSIYSSGTGLRGKCKDVSIYHMGMLLGKINNPTGNVNTILNYGKGAKRTVINSTAGMKQLIDNGKLATVWVYNEGYGQHWVTLVGYKGSGLVLGDFLFLDSYRGNLNRGTTGLSTQFYNGSKKSKESSCVVAHTYDL